MERSPGSSSCFARGLILSSALALGCTGAVQGGEERGGDGDPAPGGPSRPGGNVRPGSGATPGSEMPPNDSPAAMPGSCRVGPSPLRRLTRAEYDNTIRDLLGDKGTPSEGLPADGARGGYDTDVSVQGASPLLAGGYLKAAERIAGRADLGPLLPCAVASGDDACARAFVERFGKRAYRRLLRPTETSQLVAFFQSHKAQGFEAAVRATVQLVLSSPQFLYRLELATAPAGQPARLSPHEVASRLSYLLWGSMPDEALFSAADAGKLQTKAEVAAQAERMLSDPRARARLRDFSRQWLALADLEDVSRDPKRYPGWSDALPAAMGTETVTFTEKLVFDENGGYADLVSAPFSYMNKPLATYLGVTPAPAGNAFEKVKLDAARHAGLLTQASVLAMNAREDQPHPIYRGRWIRAHLLCHEPPPPPPAVMVETPKLMAGATTREIFAQHARDPSCAACHRLIDPIGFGLERFDATGKWRANDRGLPIDTRGEIADAGDASGPFDGAVELGQKLARSQDAAACFATQVFRYSRGRDPVTDDACAVETIRAGFARAGGNLRALLLAMTQTEDFFLKAGGK